MVRHGVLHAVDPQLGGGDSDAGERELGGTGLGLAIVKHINPALGGAVSVHSVPGEGSTFRIALPHPVATD